MSRQTKRHEARTAAKAEASAAKITSRKTAHRALLERQTARENAGAYSERGVAAFISPSRSRIATRTIKKGKAFGRIIKTIVVGGDEISLHATKGWRVHRA